MRKTAELIACVALALSLCACPAASRTNCGVDTIAHSLVEPEAGAVSCLGNADCNFSPKPPCAAPSDNTCLCTNQNAAGNCIAGQCQWHTDPSNTSCICVHGQIQHCTLAGGGTGTQACDTTGTAWGPCS